MSEKFLSHVKILAFVCALGLASTEVTGFQAAAIFLIDLTPCEPEMWLPFTSTKMCWSISRTKKFTVPVYEFTSTNSVVSKYILRYICVIFLDFYNSIAALISIFAGIFTNWKIVTFFRPKEADNLTLTEFLRDYDTAKRIPQLYKTKNITLVGLKFKSVFTQLLLAALLNECCLQIFKGIATT